MSFLIFCGVTTVILEALLGWVYFVYFAQSKSLSFGRGEPSIITLFLYQEIELPSMQIFKKSTISMRNRMYLWRVFQSTCKLNVTRRQLILYYRL